MSSGLGTRSQTRKPILVTRYGKTFAKIIPARRVLVALVGSDVGRHG